ncbi:coatomer subunit beta'-2-like protein [Corchorus olitorius]|uniref:Coatomer subunit beta'-2-like protein n=1 Tax=Corchorus olitorius TaxID=93759 RepID=A0A1R3GX45_9ROSI|nr:coatomer subunit beta'-2-like protein [Corchorus olitorius]
MNQFLIFHGCMAESKGLVALYWLWLLLHFLPALIPNAFKRDVVQSYFDSGRLVDEQGVEDAFELLHEPNERVRTGIWANNAESPRIIMNCDDLSKVVEYSGEFKLNIECNHATLSEASPGIWHIPFENPSLGATRGSFTTDKEGTPKSSLLQGLVIVYVPKPV